MDRKKRFVQVGTGGRARFFYEALARQYSATSELVALCEINPIRLEYAQKTHTEEYGYPKVNL